MDPACFLSASKRAGEVQARRGIARASQLVRICRDLFQRSSQSIGISCEERARSVCQKFPLPRDGHLDKLRHQGSYDHKYQSDENHQEPRLPASPVVVATPETSPKRHAKEKVREY